ncbi:hypothetical protein AB0J20_29515 [Micromonospora costi]|uniref:hypothetical protein n=1 Tax=Micromonospora costi TaxID=1530042 RepID=UPI0033FD9D22
MRQQRFLQKAQEAAARRRTPKKQPARPLSRWPLMAALLAAGGAAGAAGAAAVRRRRGAGRTTEWRSEG